MNSPHLKSIASGLALSLLTIFHPNPCFSAVFNFGDHNITVPDGFTVELITDPSLTQRPITTDFDEQGRLYVAESSGSNEDVKIQLEKKPHSILRLEDVDGDGVFDQRTVFADNMMFPEGTLWHDGSLYVTAPPEIWKLTDTDNDGVADEREVWYDPGTLTNCANDLHGPFIGLDGWIYWCKGAFAEQEHILPTGEPFKTRASHVFRRHPDGGGVEPVMTGGMDNPVEVAFLPGGERIFSSTFFQHPGGGQRDGLVHAIYGGTYGKIHGVINEHPRTGEVLPVLSHLGPAAACALMRYESDSFGEDYQDNLFSSSFNLAKVTRHQVIKEGSSYRTIDTDFMVSDNMDFHPTHIEGDPDGSLIVIDTGGWYKLCCPTSQLQKPDIFGAIYRIRKTDAVLPHDPRGDELNWESMSSIQLSEQLGDKRWFVRNRARNELSKRGSPAIPSLKKTLNSSSPISRENAIWTLTRIDSHQARTEVLSGLNDENTTVRQAATHSIALWRDRSAINQLASLVQSGDPHNRRAAAEALGRIGDVDSIPALLNAAANYVDRILEHSITYALIEINDPDSTRFALKSSNPRVLRTCLIALDQMPAGDLEAREIIPFLRSHEPILLETAEWIISRHNDWGSELATYFEQRFQASDLSKEEGQRITEKLKLLLEDPAIQSLIGRNLSSNNEFVRSITLQALEGASLEQLPTAWTQPISEIVDNRDPQISAVLSVLRSLKFNADEHTKLANYLRSVSTDSSTDSEIRLLAMEALSTQSVDLHDEQLEFLGESLASQKPMQIRTSAANTLAKAQLTSKQLLRLTDFLQLAGPLELKPLLAAFSNHDDETIGLKLIESLKTAQAIESLRSDMVKPILASYPTSIQERAKSLYALLDKGIEEQAQHIENVLTSLPDGDVRRGQAVFNSPTTACNVCHAIGYLGGEIGPDLTTIGTIRSKFDLLEAVLYPSASFVRSYEPYVITTKDGTTYNGILKEETSKEVHLLMGFNVPVKIQREDIVDISTGTISLMPSGLTASLSEQELADLLEFLKQTRWR